MVPTATGPEMGVGFPLEGQHRIPPARSMLSEHHAKTDNNLMLHDCGTCKQRRDQHLMAKCDTCYLYYHLSCLNPPLTRLPKKSKLFGWQCSECDKSSDSESEQVKPPRRNRTNRYKSFTSGGSESTHTEPEATSKRPALPKLKIKPMEEGRQEDTTSHKWIYHHSSQQISPVTNGVSSIQSDSQLQVVLNSSKTSDCINGPKSSKKRRREKHRNSYSPGLDAFSIKEHKRKRKKKRFDLDNKVPHPRITIKVSPRAL
ncbi:unnamed protein product [Acanthoscelides obtectus]|nr:unnamed protein product [Acanthoscelides obtectus]CAK1655859.1 PHD finger protein 14 [Acanthoscelides obtectus]